MAHFSYFSTSSKMCLIGDIKVRAYFSSSDSAQLSMCIFRIFVCALYEPLDRHYKKIFTFCSIMNEAQSDGGRAALVGRIFLEINGGSHKVYFKNLIL